MKRRKLEMASVLLLGLIVISSALFVMLFKYVGSADLSDLEVKTLSELIEQGDLFLEIEEDKPMSILVQGSTVVPASDAVPCQIDELGRMPVGLRKRLGAIRSGAALVSPAWLSRFRPTDLCWLRFERWISNSEVMITTGELTGDGQLRCRCLRIEREGTRWVLAEFVSGTTF